MGAAKVIRENNPITYFFKFTSKTIFPHEIFRHCVIITYMGIGTLYLHRIVHYIKRSVNSRKPNKC